MCEQQTSKVLASRRERSRPFNFITGKGVAGSIPADIYLADMLPSCWRTCPFAVAMYVGSTLWLVLRVVKLEENGPTSAATVTIIPVETGS